MAMPKPDKKTDRAALLAFADAVDTRPKLLKPDEYNDWRLMGSKGHVYAIPEAGAFYVYVTTNSARAWTHAKKAIGYPVSQDGDDEGIFRLDRLPTAEEAKTLRRLIGLPQRRHPSPEQLERLRSNAFSSR